MDAKKLVRDFYERIVSRNLWEELLHCIAENFAFVSGENKIPVGMEGMKEHLLAVKKTYPDYSMRIIRQYEDGGTVISEFIMQGTHSGEWLGIPPSHKTLSFTGVNVDAVSEGKITEHGGAVNTFETLWDAGLIGPLHRPDPQEPHP